MRTIEDIRHARLLQLLEQYKSVKALALALTPPGGPVQSYAQLSQWKNQSVRANGNRSIIDSKSARRIELRLGLPEGWMDNDPEHEKGVRLDSLSPMAADIVKWFDGMIDTAAQYRAFVIIYGMLVAGRWPVGEPHEPSHAPIPRQAQDS